MMHGQKNIKFRCLSEEISSSP